MLAMVRRFAVGVREEASGFGACRRGNAAIIFAFACVPMLLAMSSGVDYGLAMRREARMNAAADAAALSAVTPTMMAQSATVAQAAAVAFFNTQVSSLTGVSYPSNVAITVTDTNSGSSITRAVNVSYRAASANNFGGVLGMPTLTIQGISAASAAVSPNIDFYLMLDTSPSMAIAATQAGIATMVLATPLQTGCAFACHETNPSADNLGNPGGKNQDNYALARSLGVVLRIDLVTQAVQNLMTTASQTEQSTSAVYRMAGYTFDVSTSNPIPLTSNLTTAQSEAANIQMLTVYDENNLTALNSNNDEDTNFNAGFSALNTAMPNPGNGTNNAGDSPQEVLFIVTDGVQDTAIGSSRNYAPLGIGTQTGSTDWCTAIKARGIRIAVLYTTYNPLPTNSWYNTYLSAEQPTIATKAQACASSGLYFQVNTGGDISAAMTTLFSTAVSSAHLTQ
jgi:Flp pilus assembly protein TadG